VTTNKRAKQVGAEIQAIMAAWQTTADAAALVVIAAKLDEIAHHLKNARVNPYGHSRQDRP
jgi:hypothetical protein